MKSIFTIRFRTSAHRLAPAIVIGVLGFLPVTTKGQPSVPIIPIQPSQITATPDGQVWNSPVLMFNKENKKKNEVLELNFKLDRPLRITDAGFFNNDESIHFRFDGAGYTPGGSVQYMYYTWEFTGVTGDYRAGNPIVGLGILNGSGGVGYINSTTNSIMPFGDSQAVRFIDLTRRSFTFTDLHLSVVVPPSVSGTWSPDQVTFSVAADKIAIVPEPNSVMVYGIGLFGVSAFLFGRRICAPFVSPGRSTK